LPTPKRTATGSIHPYWPRDLLIPTYVANNKSMSEILAFLFSISGVFLLFTWVLTGQTGTKRSPGTLRRLAVCWFAVCGFIHGVIEGWFSLYYDIIPGDQSFLSQLCEYLTPKEITVTAWLWGPFSFWAVYAFLTNKSYRFVLQLIISVGQLYGVVLYFFTEHRDGYAHSELGHPVYFWFYYVFMNVLWVVIPMVLIVDSWRHLTVSQLNFDNAMTAKTKKN
uniref:EBP cholestenol delta-isomerase n=1 Tax=Gouania willdenowi TaxID=441366 RepID=A0A8C5D9V3_GOUWI